MFSSTRSVLPVSAVVGTLLFAGCGNSRSSDDQQVSEVVQSYLQALGTGSYKQGCNQLDVDGRADLVQLVAGEVPEFASTSCVTLLQRLRSVSDARSRAILREAKVRSVNVRGDTATAQVRGATQSPTLRRSGGTWRISDLDGHRPPAARPANEIKAQITSNLRQADRQFQDNDIAKNLSATSVQGPLVVLRTRFDLQDNRLIGACRGAVGGGDQVSALQGVQILLVVAKTGTIQDCDALLRSTTVDSDDSFDP